MGDEAGATPVFVDPTGRRSRLLVRVFWAVGALMTAYVVLVAVSLVGTPGLSRLTVPGIGPVLPGPAAAPLANGTGGHARPARLLPTSRATSAPAGIDAPSSSAAPPSSLVAGPGPAGSPAARTTGRPTGGPSPARSARATASAQPNPAHPTPQPTSTKVPPGQASAHPTPRSSHTPNPHSTKTKAAA